MSVADPLPRQHLPTTMVMSLAATAAALIAIFGDKSGWSALTVAFALVGLVPWALVAGGVRLHPVLFLIATLLPAAVIVLGDRNPGGMFAAMIIVVSVVRENDNRWLIGTTVGLGAALIIGLAVLEGTTHETGAIYFLGGIGVAFLCGTMLRRQEVLLTELRDAQARQSEHAAAAERTRIAREIHDVVAHSLTVTMLHVTGARRALATDPARAAEALERAEAVGRDSLASIRQTVGLLRSREPEGDDPRPLPDIDGIPALVDQYRQAGLTVSADLRLDGLSTDPTTSLAAFRVVQEALSNVLQHAPGAPVELSVGRDCARVLRIVAENPTTIATVHGASPRAERTGLGLRGMAERVRAAGGSVEAGATARQTWRLEAALPLRRAAAVAT